MIRNPFTLFLLIACSLNVSAQDFLAKRIHSTVSNNLSFTYPVVQNENTRLNKQLKAPIFPMGQKGYFGTGLSVYGTYNTDATTWEERTSFGCAQRYSAEPFFFEHGKIGWLWVKSY